MHIRILTFTTSRDHLSRGDGLEQREDPLINLAFLCRYFPVQSTRGSIVLITTFPDGFNAAGARRRHREDMCRWNTDAKTNPIPLVRSARRVQRHGGREPLRREAEIVGSGQKYGELPPSRFPRSLRSRIITPSLPEAASYRP
ncbi:hypothetical protein HNY73_011681 [Argiope bruennichi]|uniref:Uncharacterized protein n=1 Tax=Argiope bruennichi TaxID=94029 RepID=A0A8T0F154_ARGBR|nr:hypothetical protein HNY73_011681 [Argiope bruennichi]